MKVCTILLGLFFLLEFNDSVGQTCDQIQYTTIKDVRRSTKYKGKPGALLCDKNFIQDDKWYRFDSAVGNKMPEQNPGSGFCGTYAPIWMRGTHPTTDNVVKDVTACGAAPFAFPIGCAYSYAIKVIKCGKFFLYRLKEPKQCYFAYCAGDKSPDTKCSVTGETLPVCPGAIPRVTVGADIKHETSEEIRLKCFWESPGNLTNVEYQARWFGDIRDANPKFQKNFTGLETPELLFQPRIFRGKLNDKIGYAFHKHVYCAVRARYKTGSWSKWATSRRIYTGIEVTPKFIPINDCGERDREVIVTLRPHLPIRGNPVNVAIYSPTSKLIDEICVVGDADGFQECGMVFQPGHRAGRPMRFKLMTNCATGDKSTTLDATYQLRPHHVDINLVNRFWVNHPFPEIKIRRTKFKKPQCWSTGDPHFFTFDGKTYDFYGRGTFLLYGNKFYGTEIQVRQRACNGGTPSCNCGIAIKENLFYKVYDMCYVTPGRPWWENNVRSRLRTHQLRDFKLSRFYSKITQQGSTTKFEITLPSGVKVIVDRQGWGLNLYVWAPQDPNNPSEGLCGNNNGDPNDDFDKWNNANDFGENQRIRTRLTHFDYKGSKFEEDQIDDGCDKKICVCSRGGLKRCGAEAEAICFPNLGTANARAHHQGSGIGECANRPKRAVDLQDDTVDDQDAIPAFNPTVTRVNVTLTWPTASGRTKENVTQFCENKLRYSKAGAACGEVEGVDVDGLVQQCITDIQATDDPSWAEGNFAALQTSCVANIFNNISSFKNTSDGSIELETDVLTSLCPNDCSDHGNCSNSTCTCDEDYTAADCSISLKDSPIVFDIRKSGLCDRRRRPCRNVGIFGFPLLDSENLTCHIQEHKVIDSAWNPSNSITLYPGQLTDLTEVKCSLPESPVNIGDYGNDGVTAAGLRIAISNNGINASTDSMVFITYDSVCQECNTTTIKCRLKTDACFISGHCFAKNDSKPSDWCQQCLPEVSTTTWTERRDNRAPVFVTSSVFYAFRGKELRVQLNANDPENRTVRYSFGQNQRFGASLNKNGSFVWTKNTNDSTTFTFNVTDECGAYSTLTVSVVIKECPCKNSGECFPDYRDMDGGGNFTCSCPSEYTGALCELDVNECNVSNPCFNGSCINQQPGFSCSCSNGYTGRLCETEINECESNPCFPSVSCTDLIATYRCGQCPSGYSGDGTNCSRIDGKVDECLKNPQVCDTNAKCRYSNGSYVCQCTQGYVGDGNNCTDVNECVQNPNICPEHSECSNIPGSYYCSCVEGYTGDRLNCSDLDECVETPNVCHAQANCTNVPGSFSCECRSGFTGNGTNCTDIDECTQSPCHSLATCLNTEGSYSCQCNNGYTGNGKMNCTDVDECQQTPCHPMATCSNTEGTFSCQCKDGLTGDGKINCTDIDECARSPCHLHATCKNTLQSYSCECSNGYIGDGTRNCTENQPPQFSTPDSLHGIFNTMFRVQINASDPEGQTLTFTLLQNGTISKAQITKQGLLDVTPGEKSGTVFIQVMDEMGAKSTLILHVNATQCPCKHNGNCYKRNTILYPVKASDYVCQCKTPYTGDLCEIAPNPCYEQPCYPGLKCTPAQNSEGFTCEDCPPSFKGDGKHCELDNNQVKDKVTDTFTLTNEKWNENLNKKTSKEYKNLVSRIIKELRKIYKDVTGFGFVIIKGFRKGSVKVDFELIFTQKMENPLEPLNKAAKTGKLGDMTFEMEKTDSDGKDDSNKILGLDQTIFIVIVVAVVAFILIIVIAVCLRRRRKRHAAENVTLNKYLPSTTTNMYVSHPEAIALNESQKDEGGEEIDLHVIENEAVCTKEEIKLQP